jgi:hypothetical protein
MIRFVIKILTECEFKSVCGIARAKFGIINSFKLFLGEESLEKRIESRPGGYLRV